MDTTTNTNEFHQGQTVVTTKAIRFLAANFPGWGEWQRRRNAGEPTNTPEFFVEVPAGTIVTVASIESHGSNPWTRYVVTTQAGERAPGVYPEHLADAD